MIKTNSIENFDVSPLNKEEMTQIKGGFSIEAYGLGKALEWGVSAGLAVADGMQTLLDSWGRWHRPEEKDSNL